MLEELTKQSFLKADLDGRKIKKASVLFDKDFEGNQNEFENSYYDKYDAVDF